MNYDWMLYSRGTYWLFEHWQEDGKNIYSKSKFNTKDDFLKCCGRYLTVDQIASLDIGESIIVDRDDGTKFFFKYVNNV